jgi:hypothetical protein
MQYNAAAGTLYAALRPFAGTDGTNRYASIVDASSANHMSVLLNTSNIGQYTVTATTTQAAIVLSAWGAGTVHKLAGSATLNLFKAAMDGVAGVDDTSGTMPVAPTHFRMSGLLSNFAVGSFHLERVMYLPRAMSTAELVTVTT